jgi:uncharacterized membrane protein YdbT with pleckstrin-like domain
VVDSVMSSVREQEDYQVIHVRKLSNQDRSLLPQGILADGEELLYESRALFWPLFVAPVFLSVLGLFIFLFTNQLPFESINTFLQLSSSETLIQNVIKWFGVSLCAMGIIGIFVKWLRWRSTIYAATNRRILQQTGVLSRCYIDCSIRNIQTSHLQVPLLGRIFSFGTITVTTAGTASTEIKWEGINKPEDVHRKLNEIIDFYR